MNDTMGSDFNIIDDCGRQTKSLLHIELNVKMADGNEMFRFFFFFIFYSEICKIH